MMKSYSMRKKDGQVWMRGKEREGKKEKIRDVMNELKK